MTVHTVKAQQHDGTMTYNRQSNVETAHELITDAVETLYETGGVIMHVANGVTTKYIVLSNTDYAVQDNRQNWIEST